MYAFFVSLKKRGHFLFFKANLKVVNIEFMMNDFNGTFIIIIMMNTLSCPFSRTLHVFCNLSLIITW